LIQERVRSDIAAEKAREGVSAASSGSGRNPIGSLRKCLQFVAEGRSYRLISRELGLSKNTVLEIIKRNRAMPA
jgi:putative DNA-invertase from lambdoid prophage Rac